jgi:hypothetical protein
VHPAAPQGEEELAPVGLGLGAGARDAQDHPPAVFQHAGRDQHRARDDAVAHADALVVGVEQQVGDGPERPLAPAGQLGVEQGGGAADLGAGDVQAADPLHHVVHLAGRDPAEVHLGDRQLQGPLAALSAFQAGRVEPAVAGLGDVEHQAAQAGVERLGLEPVGVPAAVRGALVRFGLEVGRPLELHRRVEQGGQGFLHAVKALGGQQFQELLPAVRIVGRGLLAGHAHASPLVRGNERKRGMARRRQGATSGGGAGVATLPRPHPRTKLQKG